MYRQSGGRSLGCRFDCELRSRRDVTGRVDILDRSVSAPIDRQQQPACSDLCAALDTELELLIVVLVDAQHDRVDQLDAQRPARLTTLFAQLRWTDALESEVAVDAVGFPVAGIAAVDDD